MEGRKYKHAHEKAAARIDDDGRSPQRPVAQNTTINHYSGVIWRLGSGVAAAEIGLSHRRGNARHMSEAAARRPQQAVPWIEDEPRPTWKKIIRPNAASSAAGASIEARGCGESAGHNVMASVTVVELTAMVRRRLVSFRTSIRSFRTSLSESDTFTTALNM